jgi:glycosyltransferase involved in cell wall biosynthesis
VTVLLFNQRVDLDDPGQRVAIDWMEALAKRVDRLVVVTHHAGRVPTIGNTRIYSLGRERGWSKVRRAAEFYRLLAGILRRERPAFCLTHMVPILTVLAGPVLRRRRIPILQWFTHRATPWELRLAHRFAARVLTATAESFRLPSHKVVVTGHGIPTDRFVPGERNEPRLRPTIVTVGRVSPVKRLETVVDALAQLRAAGGRARLLIVGDARIPSDRGYLADIRERVRAAGVEEAVEFTGNVDRDRLIEIYRTADVFAHACDSGLDKAVLEAMSCALPVVSSSAGFRELLGGVDARLVIPSGNAQALAESLEDLLARPPDARRAIGERLREIVIERHDLARLMDRIVALGTAA